MILVYSFSFYIFLNKTNLLSNYTIQKRLSNIKKSKNHNSRFQNTITFWLVFAIEMKEIHQI